MQCAVIEFSRNVCGLDKANSTEFDEKTAHPVISLLESQHGVENKGGTMRLGAWDCKLVKGTHAEAAYGKEMISERHRHRFEFNNDYKEKLTKKGLRVAGTTKDGKLVEIVEVADHPWFVGVQFHPEFKSRPLCPHPLFRDFVKASIEKNGHEKGKKAKHA